jgi:hypothetical protein
LWNPIGEVASSWISNLWFWEPTLGIQLQVHLGRLIARNHVFKVQLQVGKRIHYAIGFLKSNYNWGKNLAFLWQSKLKIVAFDFVCKWGKTCMLEAFCFGEN